jgi:putative transposase
MQAVESRFGATSKAIGDVEWLTDNGSCYTASKTRSFAGELELMTGLRSPQSNGVAERFVRTFKRDYADLASRPDAQTTMRHLAVWFEHYNTLHPHSALGCFPLRLFREK